MNPIEQQTPTWYTIVENRANENDLSIVNIGFTPGQGVYWDIPCNQYQVTQIKCEDAKNLFNQDLIALTPAKVVLIDWIFKKITITSLDLYEEISASIPSEFQTTWLWNDTQLIPCALEILVKHMHNPDLDSNEADD